MRGITIAIVAATISGVASGFIVNYLTPQNYERSGLSRKSTPELSCDRGNVLVTKVKYIGHIQRPSDGPDFDRLVEVDVTPRALYGVFERAVIRENNGQRIVPKCNGTQRSCQLKLDWDFLNPNDDPFYPIDEQRKSDLNSISARRDDRIEVVVGYKCVTWPM